MGNYEQDIAFLVVEGAVAAQKRGAAVQGGVDFLCYLIVFLRKNHELVGLSVSVNHNVGHDDGDEQHHEAVNQAFYVVEYEIGAADDDQVDGEADPAVGYVAVFADHEGDDVDAAGVSAPVYRHSDAEGGHCGAYDHAHEHVVNQRTFDHGLENRQEAAQYESADQRVDAEFWTEDLPRHGNEDGVHDEGGDAHRYRIVDEVDYRGRTRHAAARHAVRKQKRRPPEGEYGQSYDDENVIFDFPENIFACYL